MKNAMKKLLSLVLVAMLLISAVPVQANAAGSPSIKFVLPGTNDDFSMDYAEGDPVFAGKIAANYVEFEKFIVDGEEYGLEDSVAATDGLVIYINNTDGLDATKEDPKVEDSDDDEQEEDDTYEITLVVYEEKDNTRKEWATKKITLTTDKTTLAELVALSGYGDYESVTGSIMGASISGRAKFAIEDGDQVDLYIVPESKGSNDKHEKPGNKPADKEENTKPGKGEKVTLRVFHNDGTSNHTDISCRTTDNLLDVINSSKELRNLSRKGYELIGWAFEANNDTEKEWIAAQHTVADDDDLRVYADWKENSSNNGRPGHDDDNDDYHNVYVDLNYDDKMGDTVKRVIDGAKMSRVLKYVEEPTRRGYSFAGWYWDAKCKYDVDGDEKVTKDCTIYAKWTKKSSNNEVLLKIYLNENTKAAAKVVDMDAYDNDGKITLTEVEKVVRKYYEEKYDDDDMDIDGLFTTKTWNNGRYSMKHAEKSIKVNDHDDTVIYVMVRDAQKISSGTADTSNPKTGDNIMMVVSVMIMSGAALAYVFSKKRAAR